MKFNGSELPNEVLLYSQNTLTKVEFDSENIAKIISSLDLNKLMVMTCLVFQY